MMTELVLVEGVSDVQLISYYLQNVYGWKHEKENKPFFSVRNPKNAMRAFGTYISTIDWSKSASLRALLLPLEYLGKEKPV